MWTLTALFSLRVLGQAVQRWLPQSWLPTFSAWQGSSMPYALLLLFQLVIVAAMTLACYRAWYGRTIVQRRTRQWLAGVGVIYMTLALARIAIGISVASAPLWFTAWISGVFHVVLAAFLLAYAGYHYLREPAPVEP
jgi:hypothetical protein